MTYSEKLRDPRWQKKRLLVLEREGWKCQSCGSAEKSLQIHHLIYSPGEPWDAPDNTLECLCFECHDFRTSFDEFFHRGTAPTKDVAKFYNIFRAVFKYWKETSEAGHFHDCTSMVLDTGKYMKDHDKTVVEESVAECLKMRAK